MADVLNRTTKQHIQSANTPDYPVAEWIINPDLSAVAGFPSQYWIITGDVVTLMDQAQRDAVDLAALEATRDTTAGRMDAVEDVIRALALAVLDELNLHATRQVQLLDAIDAATSLATLQTAVGAINDIPQRTGAQLKAVIRNKLGT